eukprot:Gb_00118 [translate_table: standard]
MEVENASPLPLTSIFLLSLPLYGVSFAVVDGYLAERKGERVSFGCGGWRFWHIAWHLSSVGESQFASPSPLSIFFKGRSLLFHSRSLWTFYGSEQSIFYGRCCSDIFAGLGGHGRGFLLDTIWLQSDWMQVGCQLAMAMI